MTAIANIGIRTPKTEALFEYIAETLKRIEAQTALSAKDILTVEEAALYAGVSTHHIYNLVHKRKIPYYKMTKRVYFKKDELRDWMLATRVETKQETQERAERYVTLNPRA